MPPFLASFQTCRRTERLGCPLADVEAVDAERGVLGSFCDDIPDSGGSIGADQAELGASFVPDQVEELVQRHLVPSDRWSTTIVRYRWQRL